MIVTRVPLTLEDLPGFTVAKCLADAASRAPGVHLSHIIKYIMVRGYGKNYGSRDVDAASAIHMDLGFMWEDIFCDGLRTRMLKSKEGVQGTEIICDEIAMNPDMIVPAENRIEEYKWTKRSLRKFKEAPETHFADWCMQMQGYIVGCQRTLGLDIRTARLVPLFVNGDYTWKPPDGDTTMYVCDFEWEQWELDENWTMMLTNKVAMESEIKGGTWI